MTILPKKKERNTNKNQSGSESHSVDEHQHTHRHNYHHSSPPRWSQLNEQRRSNRVVNQTNVNVNQNETNCDIINADTSKRSSTDADIINVNNTHQIDNSGPSHGSKRTRQRNANNGSNSNNNNEKRYFNYTNNRNKNKSSTSSTVTNSSCTSSLTSSCSSTDSTSSSSSTSVSVSPTSGLINQNSNAALINNSNVNVGIASSNLEQQFDCIPGTSTSSIVCDPISVNNNVKNVRVDVVDDVSEEDDDDVDDEEYEGYNSGDEYRGKHFVKLTSEEFVEMDKKFEKMIRKKGLRIKPMCEDGACLFRAVADQVYGDQEMHTVVRKLCIDYMAKNVDYFSQYVTEDFQEYLKRKSVENSHGNHIEIQAMSEIYNRPIQVYHYSTAPIKLFQGSYQTDNEPIRLSYHRNVHYNSLIDPYKATIGVGLGLPSFKPGLADRNLLDNAIRTSEEHELEKAMLEDKIRATDWEATNEAIEEQVARESYLEWLRENEKRSNCKGKKSKHLSASATSTVTTNSTTTGNQSPQNHQQSPSRFSPKAGSSGVNNSTNENETNRDFTLIETASFMNELPSQFLGIPDWETQENDILARVLAQSQQEYLDSLKRNASSNKETTKIDTAVNIVDENQASSSSSSSSGSFSNSRLT